MDSKTERMWWAYGKLLTWIMNNRTHPAYQRVVNKLTGIDESMDPAIQRMERR